MARKGLQALLTQYWQAQARLSTDIAIQVLRSFSSISPTSPADTGARWVGSTLTAIRASRAKSVALATAFYRLYRALETGSTLALPGREDGALTLGDLRDEWARTASLPTPHYSDDSSPVTVDDFDWPDLDNGRFDRQAAVALASAGPGRVSDLVQEHRGRLDDPAFLESLESAARGAANVAGRETSRPGREQVDQVGKRDGRVIGWARVTDGDPCHFCSMLASRGAVYKTKNSASISNYAWDSDDPEALKKYHPGCHCQVVPVFTRADFLTPEARRLQREWREVTKGKSGDEARLAWRRYIDDKRRSAAKSRNTQLLQSAREAYGNVNTR